jgi:HNH endonuclease
MPGRVLVRPGPRRQGGDQPGGLAILEAKEPGQGADPRPPLGFRLAGFLGQRRGEGVRGVGQRGQPQLPYRGPVVRPRLAYPVYSSPPKLRRSVSPFGDPPSAAEIRSQDQSAARASRTATRSAFCATRRASIALFISSSTVVVDTPPATCQVHHVKPKASGGPTTLGNLVLLCAFHHLIAVHQRGWSLTLHPDGTITAISPDRSRTLHSHGPPSRAA